MKNKNTIQSVLFQNLTNQIVETGNIDTLNTQIHNTSVSWLDASSSIKDGRVTFVLWSQTYHVSEIMRSSKFFSPNVSEIPTLAYNWTSSVVV